MDSLLIDFFLLENPTWLLVYSEILLFSCLPFLLTFSGFMFSRDNTQTSQPSFHMVPDYR